MTFADEIREVLQQCRDCVGSPEAPFYMPDFVRILERMLKAIEAGQWESRNTNTGLSYMVLDDYDFAGTRLGLRLGKIAVVWAGVRKWEEVQ
jgi:hypothetical protein